MVKGQGRGWLNETSSLIAARTKPNVTGLVDRFLARREVTVSVVDASVDKGRLSRADEKENDQILKGSSDRHVSWWKL